MKSTNHPYFLLNGLTTCLLLFFWNGNSCIIISLLKHWPICNSYVLLYNSNIQVNNRRKWLTKDIDQIFNKVHVLFQMQFFFEIKVNNVHLCLAIKISSKFCHIYRVYVTIKKLHVNLLVPSCFIWRLIKTLWCRLLRHIILYS